MDNLEANLVATIEHDNFYKHYLQPYSKNTLLQAVSISDQVKKLGEGIILISEELQKQVLENYDDLLRQGNHASKLEIVLNTVNDHVQNLFANAERLKNQIMIPYNALRIHTKVLGRLHLASHILRQVSRIQQLNKRLLNTNDSIQKATILYELEQLASDSDLKDIDVIASELRNIRSKKQQLLKLASGYLNQGIINGNEGHTLTALQIFINFGTIHEMLDKTIEIAVDECRQSLKAAFAYKVDVTKSNKGPGSATFTSSQGFRKKIWFELEKAFGEEMYQQCKQIKFLQSSVMELHIQNLEENIASRFWSKLGDALRSEINSSNSAIQQMLGEDYSNLLKSFCEMIDKLNYEPFSFNREYLEKCENLYLSSSLTKLLDLVQGIFINDNGPSHDQIESLIRLITSELSKSLVEEMLSEKIAKNVSKSIKMYCLKTEQQIETSSEAAQVIARNPNSCQNRNCQHANALYYFQLQIQRICDNMKESLSEKVLAIIVESIQSFINLTEIIIQPIIDTINSTLETIIITIHLENDWNKLQTSTKTTLSASPYMRELIQFITRAYNTYLANFDHKDVLFAKTSYISIRCIELLVRHSALLRPISQGGRFRLYSDYLHLEQCLKLICPHFSDLGRPYRLFKSMASLVTLKPEEIVAGHASESSVPHSTILFLLFSFAGSDLASPHQNTMWSLPKISQWLDEHTSEVDRLDLITGALQRYETMVRQKNSINYDPVYPVMSKFIESAVKSIINN